LPSVTANTEETLMKSERFIRRLIDWKRACALFLFCAATALALPAQTFTNLVSFNGSNGMFPWNTPLVQGLDGDLYGTTDGGGIVSRSCGAFNSCGTVFKITPKRQADHALQVLLTNQLR
jgi:hypothetical protein